MLNFIDNPKIEKTDIFGDFKFKYEYLGDEELKKSFKDDFTCLTKCEIITPFDIYNLLSKFLKFSLSHKFIHRCLPRL